LLQQPWLCSSFVDCSENRRLFLFRTARLLGPIASLEPGVVVELVGTQTDKSPLLLAVDKSVAIPGMRVDTVFVTAAFELHGSVPVAIWFPEGCACMMFRIRNEFAVPFHADALAGSGALPRLKMTRFVAFQLWENPATGARGSLIVAIRLPDLGFVVQRPFYQSSSFVKAEAVSGRQALLRRERAVGRALGGESGRVRWRFF